MEAAVLLITHILAVAFGFAVGKYLGYTDAQPKRDRKGRFSRKG